MLLELGGESRERQKRSRFLQLLQSKKIFASILPKVGLLCDNSIKSPEGCDSFTQELKKMWNRLYHVGFVVPDPVTIIMCPFGIHID